jgi:hypothetical protein
MLRPSLNGTENLPHMSHPRTRLGVILGLLLVVVGVVGVLVYSRLQSLTALKPLTVSYATVATTRPEGSPCAGDGSGEPTIAKEIFNLDSDDIYVAGGTNPMPDEVWRDYRFRLPFLKNSTRNLMFESSCFFRSPDAPADCTGAACFTVETLFEYTWLKLTTVVGQSCFPDAAGCRGDVVDAGYVSINTIAKCHEITYAAGALYLLSDGTGNRYVMHATGTGVPDLSPSLPAGWSLERVEVDEPFTIHPFGGGESCYYNVLRDSLVQSYHQIEYAGQTYP